MKIKKNTKPTKPKMSVNYWKNVFLSPLCDRSYKTGIYSASQLQLMDIDFAFAGATIYVLKSRGVSRRDSGRNTNLKACMPDNVTTKTCNKYMHIAHCSHCSHPFKRFFFFQSAGEFDNAIIWFVYTYKFSLGTEWTDRRTALLSFFLSVVFELFKSIVTQASTMLMRSIRIFSYILLLLFGVILLLHM